MLEYIALADISTQESQNNEGKNTQLVLKSFDEYGHISIASITVLHGA
jgi:hypothetical protein